MVASLVGFLILVQAVWLWRLEPRRWVKNLGWIALAAVIVQGVLAAFSFVWFFWGVAATGEELLIGGKLSLLAGGALIVTTVTEGIYGSTILRTDWARRPWRFSMRQLTFATLVAGPALGWIALYLIAK